MLIVQQVSSIRVYLPRDLRSPEARQAAGRSVKEVQKRFKDGVPLLDPVEDLQIEDEAFKKVVRKIETLEDQLAANPAFSNPEMIDKYNQLLRRKKLEAEMKELRRQLKATDSVVMKDELKAMKRVLRRLGYTNAEGVIELKGRVCCEINAADEIVLSEMMFNGVFNGLTPEQCAALLCCIVFQEKSAENQKLPDDLSGPLQILQDTARKVARISQECKLTVNTEEYVQSFRPHMMDVVFQWAKGAKFLDICKMTDIFEGSIIRCMRRLEELIRQLCQVRVLGIFSSSSFFRFSLIPTRPPKPSATRSSSRNSPTPSPRSSATSSSPPRCTCDAWRRKSCRSAGNFED